MHVLVSCKNEDAIKNEVFPAIMKKIQSKMKALECSQYFSHCKSMGIFSKGQGQLTPQCMIRSG